MSRGNQEEPETEGGARPPAVRNLIKAVIFDLDGTLADSAHIMHELYGSLFEEFGIPSPSEGEVMKVIAHGGRRIIHELLPEGRKNDLELKEKMGKRSAEISRSLIRKIRPMEGAEELLAWLGKRGIRVVIATNRGATTKELLEFLGLSKYVEVSITSADVENMKPHPEPLLKALAKLGLGPDEAVFVGDTDVDLKAGAAAGIKTLLLSKDKVGGQHIKSLHGLKVLLENGW